MANEKYDVVVIGGGAAGLAGALTLARARRSVLVVDAGTPRNAPAGHVHNYLAREGTPPGELLTIGRTEVTGYGGEIVSGTVVSAEAHDHGFRVALDDGTAVLARRLLVTTGLIDELPDVPGVAQQWGNDVLHCPYCHGWEVRDQAIGVLATGPMAVHQALLFRQWSADVTLFRHTGPDLTDEQIEELTARGVAVVDGEVAAWEETGVRLVSGEVVPRQALVVAPLFTARSDVLAGLGLKPTEMEVAGHVIGTYIAADPTGATEVQGVWVAGNVADPRAQVISAAAGGLNAAAMINADLVTEDTRVAVEVHRMFSEQAWEERYRAKPAIWSGQPNQQLVAEATDLAPGTALDVGSGEGADALWLAARGWQVTGVDISTVALARAADHAKAAGEQVRWVHADLTADAPFEERFDLVSAHFMHLPPAQREELYARLADLVAPGGTLLVVGHHPSDLHTSAHRPPMPEMFFTAEQIANSLDHGQWEVLVTDTRPRQAKLHEGGEIAVHDAILRARRR
jgi:thioredoxin reductase/SAM-dependent methyltransferase